MGGIKRHAAYILMGITLTAPLAQADALRLRFSTKVATGEKPRVTLIAEEPVDSVEVKLTDEQGRATTARIGPMARGAQREVVVPALPGKHRFEGQLTVRQGGKTRDSSLSFETVVAPQLTIAVDKARVNVAARTLEARFSRPAARAEIKVSPAAGGATPVETTQDLGGAAADTPLVIKWPTLEGDAPVGRIDLRLHDTDGFHAGVALFPWSVYIPHEEVSFATDSAEIARAEEPKLEASLGLITAALARHKNLGPIRLYIAGHTDSVGKPAYNLALSQRRAQAIASWFRRRGLRMPVLFEGFGEHAPLVGTPDEKDEPRNRRVDYILAVEDPVLKVAGGMRVSWKRLP